MSSFSIIDVFSHTAYKGNPLAVVPNTLDTLSTTQMRLIARQFNLSETTFICPATTPVATYRLRSFLPNGEEVFGAGHNALGAWWYIIYTGLVGISDAETPTPTPVTFHQQLGVDVLPVEVSRSVEGMIEIAMRQGPPQFLDIHRDLSALAAAVGLAPSDIGFEVHGVLVSETKVVTTSPARHLLIPVVCEEVLRRARFDNEAVAKELSKTDSQNSGVYLFAPVGEADGGIPRFEARFFSPGMGCEDPATGSAAGPLVAYLWENGVVGSLGQDLVQVEVVQGLQRGRECVMKVGLLMKDGKPMGVMLRGKGTLVAEGRLVVPDGIDF
ncbi:hypothetical protein EYZ11_001039 [Aspergillus tanneri]|uniref:Phenazine biosynthesis protein n=1 Tax=Aspergillus tanneri TaxID=1220188 RepID=A0A4V3UQP9_9EURO|nr:uncharacterized protein ATNIH1004_001575 [Aspergillus tanneri]KAA8652670.1 hypothetical protein ATNIH1004_001575 [Aspergillus tanneri]THC99490.1 hypothetical protein EYZ11_001039 [Aspergillus tanneri]